MIWTAKEVHCEVAWMPEGGRGHRVYSRDRWADRLVADVIRRAALPSLVPPSPMFLLTSGADGVLSR